MRHTEMQRNIEWSLAFAAACEERAETPEDVTVAMWLERSAMAKLDRGEYRAGSTAGQLGGGYLSAGGQGAGSIASGDDQHHRA